MLDVKSEAYEIPTIQSVLALHDNYEMDVKKKETVTPEERKEEAELLVKFLETDVFKATMKFLVDKGFVPNDQYDFEDTLKRIWFSQFQRVEGEPSSSGFEAVFVAEKLDSYMIGPQNWIYFAKQEAQKHLDYRGYIKDVKLGDVSNRVFCHLSCRDVILITFLITLCRKGKLSRYAQPLIYRTRNMQLRPSSWVFHPSWRWLSTLYASTFARTTFAQFH